MYFEAVPKAKQQFHLFSMRAIQNSLQKFSLSALRFQGFTVKQFWIL